MTPIVFVLAAALGAVARLVVGELMCSWRALFVVNTAGAAALGWAVSTDLSAATLTVIGAGFCGALTTYSSFALEARSLGWRWGTGYAALTVATACAAASLGSSFA